jgi:tetratricopeptide (TPR) repeat protein
MMASRVLVRFGCTFLVAGFSLYGQYTAEYSGYYRPDQPSQPYPPDVFKQTQRDSVPDGPTVSLHHLSHEVPGKALKEWNKGTKAAQDKHWDEAVARYKKAVQIDPEFVEAVNDLGAAYAKMQRLDEATAQFEKAIKIDAHYAPGFYNLALVYLMQERLPDAERAARTAVDVNRTSNMSKLVLGMALVLQDKFTDEAVSMLEKANEDYAQAHLFLARALAGRGEKESAKSEIETYLASGDRSGQELARSWLETLR